MSCSSPSSRRRACLGVTWIKAWIERLADSVVWLRVGQLQAMLDAIRDSAVPGVVMAGQIAPRNLFNARPDARMLGLLEGSLSAKAAEQAGKDADQWIENYAKRQAPAQ